MMMMMMMMMMMIDLIIRVGRCCAPPTYLGLGHHGGVAVTEGGEGQPQMCFFVTLEKRR